jgi:hypothetical protein
LHAAIILVVDAFSTLFFILVAAVGVEVVVDARREEGGGRREEAGGRRQEGGGEDI